MAINGRMNRTLNTVCICFDNVEDFTGRIYTCFDREPVDFTDLPEFFRLVEAVCNEVSFPEQKTRNRLFKKTEIKEENLGIIGKDRVLDPEKLLENKGERGEILLSIFSRENSNIQGMVYMPLSNENVAFKSEVELVRIIKGLL